MDTTLNLTHVGTLFNQYKVYFPIDSECSILIGPNGSYKTKTLELLRDYWIKSGENVLYFDSEIMLNITYDDVINAKQILESHAVANIMSGEYNVDLFAKWDVNYNLLGIKRSIHEYYGYYIHNGILQLVNFATQIINAGDNVVVIIDAPEINIDLNNQQSLLNDILHLLNVKKLIVATHSPQIISNLMENIIDMQQLIENIFDRGI